MLYQLSYARVNGVRLAASRLRKTDTTPFPLRHDRFP